MTKPKEKVKGAKSVKADKHLKKFTPEFYKVMEGFENIIICMNKKPLKTRGARV